MPYLEGVFLRAPYWDPVLRSWGGWYFRLGARRETSNQQTKKKAEPGGPCLHPSILMAFFGIPLGPGRSHAQNPQ